MVKNLICLLLFCSNLSGMEIIEEHYKAKEHKKRSNSQEFVTININPPKEDKFEVEAKTSERKDQLKIAAISAASAIIGAGITAAVTLTIHFTQCNQN